MPLLIKGQLLTKDVIFLGDSVATVQVDAGFYLKGLMIPDTLKIETFYFDISDNGTDFYRLVNNDTSKTDYFIKVDTSKSVVFSLPKDKFEAFKYVKFVGNADAPDTTVCKAILKNRE
jgi:hypothetical protein